MSRARRIAKEIEDAQKDPSDDIQIEIPNPADLSHLKGIFKGPPDTPYEGGRYVVDIQTPNEYPFKPPRMKFDTKVYHPNISSQTGAICLDILKDAWTPILTLKSTLISLQSLLNSPEPNDPQDAEVARHYLTDRKGFNDTARYWAKIYAGAGSSGATSSSQVGGSSSEAKHQSAKKQPVPDPIELYGLDRDTVKHFTSMGFSQEKVIEVLRRLNLKKLTGASGQEDQILEGLLK